MISESKKSSYEEKYTTIKKSLTDDYGDLFIPGIEYLGITEDRKMVYFSTIKDYVFTPTHTVMRIVELNNITGRAKDGIETLELKSPIVQVYTASRTFYIENATAEDVKRKIFGDM